VGLSIRLQQLRWARTLAASVPALLQLPPRALIPWLQSAR